ncbi:DUF3307 domain-containing protein [Streptomyces zagrosensis]|uniref:DUF3307 domain-containing protein n=1 Tax=Streptomyces zagrosensis TaxID=1042984 RepID=A0A7W9QEG7_9ACTN|nr:DUF3307 domain-containing protein [Streptomyces zagrosensis]MBB5938750.1 hypothetical protein [Streptomyces zagrosensis]
MFASIFVLLYVAHLLADYPFQTDHQAALKDAKTASGRRANFTHAITHVTISAILLIVGALLLDLDCSVPVSMAALVWIGASHSFIDRRWPVELWMIKSLQSEILKKGGAEHVDQTAHITALAIAALVIATLS